MEHDAEFPNLVAQELERKSLDNCTLLLRQPEPLPPEERILYGTSSFTSAQAQYHGLSFERYVKTIDDYPDESYDLVVVDGRARASCVQRAISKIRPGGYLLLDNSERTGYVGATELLKRYPRTDFYGLVPCNLEPYQTSVWRIAPSA